MGRFINPDQKMSDDDKAFLRGRAREDEVIENERRFPDDAEPAAHEADGYMPTKVGYDYEKQAAKIEDAGGIMIERIPTDDEGRPMVEEYGYVNAIVKDDGDDDDDEPQSPAEPADADGDDLDDDILDKVLEMNVEELKTELEKRKAHVSGNKDELVDRLANLMQDERDALDAKAENKG